MLQLIHFSLKAGHSVLLDDVTLSFPPGKINHVLGKNGTGKSTMAKAIAGFFPYQGQVVGLSENTIVLGSYSALPSDLRVHDIFKLARAFEGSSHATTLIEKLGLNELDPSKRIGKLSDGQKQKLKLLYYFSKNPKTAILDECTNALDKASASQVKTFLRALNGSDITTINITHDISDLEGIPGNYYLIDDQTIRGDYTKDALIDKYIRG